MSGPPPNGGYHQGPYPGQPPHFQQPPPYGQQFPPGGQNGYMGGGPPGWGGGQQQPPPPPHYGGGPGWGPGGGQGPPPHMYRQGPPPPNGMDRGNWNQYRGRPGDASPPQRKPNKGNEGPPGYWGQQQQQQQQQQWPPQQWGGGPPPPPHAWQGGGMQQPGPSPPPPHGMPPKMWPGRNGIQSPPRPPRRSPDMMGYDHKDDPDGMYMSRGVGPGDSKMDRNLDKDKGRGSYRCGRCGAPKKGHVCPYQPKLKRRPDEPPPEMRNAAVQVEMDEFMTLRRLNIAIQGFPESYATGPLLTDNMVVGEPHPLALSSTTGILTQQPGEDDGLRSPPPTGSTVVETQ